MYIRRHVNRGVTDFSVMYTFCKEDMYSVAWNILADVKKTCTSLHEKGREQASPPPESICVIMWRSHDIMERKHMWMQMWAMKVEKKGTELATGGGSVNNHPKLEVFYSVVYMILYIYNLKPYLGWWL